MKTGLPLFLHPQPPAPEAILAQLTPPAERFYANDEFGGNMTSATGLRTQKMVDITPQRLDGIPVLGTQALVRGLKGPAGPVLIDVGHAAVTLPGAQTLLFAGLAFNEAPKELAYEPQILVRRQCRPARQQAGLHPRPLVPRRARELARRRRARHADRCAGRGELTRIAWVQAHRKAAACAGRNLLNDVRAHFCNAALEPAWPTQLCRTPYMAECAGGKRGFFVTKTVFSESPCRPC
jgi:hypothetical protein